MRRVLFTTFGSYGDLFPYIAIGIELQARGHRVTIGTSPTFRSKVEGAGLNFHPIRPDVSLEDPKLLEYLFDAKRGSERVIRLVSSVARESYDDTFEAARDADLIVTHPITFSAVLIARKRAMPWASTVLAPLTLMSVYDPPVLAPAPWLTKKWPFGRTLLGAVLGLGKRAALPWMKPVLQLYQEQRVPSAGNPLFEGANSPKLVLALFSRVLGEPQPDWPANTVQTGFHFYAEQTAASLDPELKAFMSSGDAIVFTLGSSAVSAAGSFYRDSLQAVQQLGARALFLTGAQSQGLPNPLPPGVLARAYAPHGLVFQRAASIVHQGGVGTTAQALRSGRPMLVVPFSHDQFDNGERIKRLGAGEVLYRSQYSVAEAARKLEQITGTRAATEAAARVARIIHEENGAAAAADALEKL